MAAENVGFNALFDITGHYSVHRGKDGKYFFSASSAGSTPASSQGTVEFQGSAVLMVNGKTVSQIPFVNHGDGINPIFPKGFSRIGSLSLQLPTSGTVMINLQFSYHIQFGSAGERHSCTLTVPVYIRTIGLPRN